MTLKEIAKLANVASSTIRLWIKRAETAGDDGQNLRKIEQKLREATATKKAADFTPDETLYIVRIGGNETLASLLAENLLHRDTAPQIPPMDNRLDRLERMLETAIRGIIIANNTLMQMVVNQNTAQLALPSTVGEQVLGWIRDIQRKAEAKAVRQENARKDEIVLPFLRREQI